MRARWGIGVVVAAVVVLGLSAGCGGGKSQTIIDGPFGSPAGPNALSELAGRSDYLLIGRVASDPSKTEHYESGLQDWSVRLAVTEVVARRPTAKAIGLGETVNLAVETGDGRDHPEIRNYGALEGSELSVVDLPTKGATVIAFAAMPSSPEGGLRLWGHAVLSDGGGLLTLLGFNLRGVPAVSREAMTTDLVPDFAGSRS
jgi:hypothetical protein